MTFPRTKAGGGDLVPSARTFESGDFPVKTYKAQNGVEHRILYGSNRTNMKLSLTYANIKDEDTEQFLDHYHDMKGTFQTFNLARITFNRGNAKGGWRGNSDALGAETFGNTYRYEGPPQVTQVAYGRSTVTVNLIGVL